jgi:MFS family permease
MWLIGWPLSRVVRHRPEPYGLLPDGDEPGPANVQGDVRPGAGPDEASVGTAQALRTRTFWLLAGSVALSMAAQNAVVVHAIPHLSGIGLPSTFAASIVATMTLVSIAGRIGFGWLGDRFQKRYVMALAFGLQVVGLAIFATVSEPWHLIPFLAIYAPCYGGTVPLRPAMQGEYFGRRSFGAIQGLVMGCTSLGGMIGPVFAGRMFDLFGSYRLAFFILTAVAACAVPAILFTPAPPGRRAGNRAAMGVGDGAVSGMNARSRGVGQSP